jgi:riboflavin kinase/FMN adenylyltransferase
MTAPMTVPVRHFGDEIDHGWVWGIGNFDGVHAGHQALLRACADEAARRGVGWGVITFEPHPREVLAPGSMVRLMTPPQKYAALAAAGCERVAVVPFDMMIAAWRPEDFCGRVLADWVRAAAVVVGENFRFGHRAAGTVETLKSDDRFDVLAIALVRDAGGVLSSTRLRGEKL